MTTIWAEDIRSEKNHTLGFYYFAKNVKENTKLHITASNLYRLFINGSLAGYGPARAAHGFVRKDSYSLSKYKNQNIHIAVEVFAGNVNSYYITDELPFFGACIAIDQEEIVSSCDFEAYLLHDRVQKVQRYNFQRPFAESYQMQKCRSNFYLGDTSQFKKVKTEIVEGNQVLERNIDYPVFSSVPFVCEIETGKVLQNQDNWKWEDRAIKEIGDTLKGYRYEELAECISDEVSEFEYELDSAACDSSIITSKSYRLYDFGRTLTGFINLKLSVKEKTTLYIIWDEIIWDEESKGRKEKNICFYRNTTCNIIKYVLEQGEYNLLSFEPTSLQFAKIIVLNGQVSVNDFSVVLYQNENAYRLQFRCEDSEINEIISAAANTLSQNSVDILTDCPSRERAGWLCDAYFSGKAEKLFTGKNEIERNFLENFILSPQLKDLPEGMFPMCYPADHYNGVYIPNWSMWFVLELFDYYKRTGDRSFVQRSKTKIYKLIDFFKNYLNEDGLLENLESWVFIEWSKCNDDEYIKGVNYPSNMLYAAMLLSAGKLYSDDTLITQSLKMKREIIKQSYNGEFFEDNRIRENGILTSKNHLTETCQYYAFYFGVASKEEFPALFKTMIEKFGPGRDTERVYPHIAKSNAIVGDYLRLELLLETENFETVLVECKKFFTKMAKRTGTLWEHSYAYGSLNHGFASVAGNYIVEALTGFQRADYREKKIYLKDKFVGINLIIKIPVLNQFAEITINNGQRKLTLPEGYEVKN